jgi:hypothetical protein
MVTKEQAIASHHGQTFHYTGRHDCTRIVGPRGGVKVTITQVRVSGQCKTWKTRPSDFHMPVKYGMYESFWIDAANAEDFHSPADCPLQKGMLPDEQEAPLGYQA